MDGLVADIGGTNARFQRIEAAAVVDELRLRCRDFSSFEALCAAVADAGFGGTRACVAAVAGPVADAAATITNLGWRLDQQVMARALGADRGLLLNDFIAVAHALPTLADGDLIVLGERRPADPGGLRLVLGPGTGLGVAGLVPIPDGGWLPLASEAGHTPFAPAGALEMELLASLVRRFGAVSWEHIVSGPGMVNLYGAMAEVWGATPRTDQPEEIVRLARQEIDPVCDQTLVTWVNLLADVAGNLAVSMVARGGVYLTGAIAQSLQDEFARTFRQRFEERGAMRGLCEALPTWLITEPDPGLRGARAVLAALP